MGATLSKGFRVFVLDARNIKEYFLGALGPARVAPAPSTDEGS